MTGWLAAAAAVAGWLVTARVLFTGWVSGRWKGPARHPVCTVHGSWDQRQHAWGPASRCCYDERRFEWESSLTTAIAAMAAAVPWPLVVAAVLISRPPRRQRLAARELAARRKELT